MTTVKIENTNYEVPERIASWMKQTQEIINKAKRLREAQKHYFSHRNNLQQCKALETEFDKLLDGKTPEKEAFQQELFR